MQVQTERDLQNFVWNLVEERKDIEDLPLEDYLRSLWGLICECQHYKPTYALFAELLEKSFITPPLPFNYNWFQYTQPPDIENISANLNDFEVLKQTVLFQIADLRRLSDAGTINNPHRYFGISSPTGEYWHNFEPCLMLDCAMNCIRGHQDRTLPDKTECDWATLADILEMGRIYE